VPATKGAAAVTSQHVTSALEYLDGRLGTQVSLTDPAGEWLKLKGSLDVSESQARAPTFAEALRRLPEALAALPTWLEQAAFEVELDSVPRSTVQLPLPTALRALGNARVETHARATRERGAEPAGTIELTVTGAESGVATQNCSSTRLHGKGHLAFGEGKFQAELSASDSSRQLMRVSSSGLLPFLPLVRGQSHVLSDLMLDAESQRLPLSNLPFVCQRLQGLLSATVHVEDAFGAAPRIAAEVAMDGFSQGSEQTLDVAAKLAADTKQISLDGTLTAEGKTSRIRGRLPLSTSGRTVALDLDAPVQGEVELEALPVAPLIPRDAPISHVSGSLGGRVELHGTLQAPQVSGRVQLHDVALTATALAQPLSDIQGEIRFGGDGVVIERLSVRDQGGTVKLDGRVELRGPKRLEGLFNIAANQFPLRQAGQVMATMSASAQVRTALGTNDPKVWITLHDFDTWIDSSAVKEGLDLSPHPDRVIEPAPGTAESDGSTAPGGHDVTSPRLFQKLTLYLDAGREFWIKRADFAIKLSANLQIILQSGGPNSAETSVSLAGQIQFDRGYLELLGKVFEVQKGGTLRFTGGADTTINLTAIYADRRSDKKVKVHVTGSATAPRLDFALDDKPINAGEAFQAIYGTEDSSSDTDVDAQAQAVQFVSALTAGMLTTNLRRNLGAMAPILMIDPADSEGNSQLRAGFELDSLIPDFLRGIVTGMYVEGIVSSGKENDTSGSKEVDRGVLIELFFPHNLVTSGRYGPDTTWSLDVGWQP
jgi:translocation and assembly module TamB